MDSQGPDHPLVLELNSLKSTVARFQDEAYTSAVKLQRHSLDRANAHERVPILERENEWLKAEIAVLRANLTMSDPSNSTVEQVQQLTLSLRRLSVKLTLTEDALSSKTTELVQANAELVKARLAAENAYEVGARVRGREEAAKIREHELEWRLKSAEEEKKMSEVAVGEYADLVRSMEARMNLGSTSTLVSPDGAKVEEDTAKPHSSDTLGVTPANSLVEGKLGLKRLLSEFQSDTEELQRQLGQLRGELEVVKSNHEAERKGTHLLHLDLAKAQTELQLLRIDDNTAARMVSRYMQFSQTSTNTLQSTLSALKTRHAATLSTLTSTSYSLTSKLRSAETMIDRLRASLDELGGEIMKETYGRRREVALRVKLLGREEKMLEGLRRWLRKGEEAISDAENEADNSQSRVRAALLGMTQDARILVEGLDDGLVTDSVSLSGSLARLVLAQGLVDGLMEELKVETARRMELEKAVLQEDEESSLPMLMLNGHDINQQPLVPEQQENSPNTSSSSAFASPPIEVATVQASESKLSLFEEAQPSTTTLIYPTPIDTNTPDVPSPTQDEPISSESTHLADETVTIANEQNPPAFYIHPSEDSTSNHGSTTVTLTDTIVIVAEDEPLPVDIPLPNSTPTPDIVINAEVAPPPHISVVEETGITKHSDLVIIQPDVATQDVDLSPEPSSIAALIETGPSVELVIDDATSALPPSSSDLYSGVEPPVPSNSDTSTPIPFFPSQTPVLPEKDEVKTPTPHPLLAELAKISHRYDHFQRSFRDCHLALESLKASLKPSTTTSTSSSNHQNNNRLTRDKPPELTLTPIIPLDILHAAISRLDDYTEDVRVEIEIRISDEEVLAKGYEVLLCVPGALYSPSLPVPSPSLQSDQHQLHQSHHLSQTHSDYDEDQDFSPKDFSSLPLTQSELQIKIQTFITGTDPSVTKACEGFSKKLEDVQHDIAVLKRAIHDPDPAMMTNADGPELASQTPTTAERGWTSWIRSPSTPFSASGTITSAKHLAGLGPSPTFGSIMTSPHRLKHSLSPNMNGYGNQKGSNSGAAFVNGIGSNWVQGDGGGKDDVLGRLGLRVPMPIFDSTAHPSLTPSSATIGSWGWNGLSPTTSAPIKPRSVSSTMYMLGLGASPMMTASSRSRGTSYPGTGSQKGSYTLPMMGLGVGGMMESVDSVNGRGPISFNAQGNDNLTGVGRDGHQTMDTPTAEDEQNGDVE